MNNLKLYTKRNRKNNKRRNKKRNNVTRKRAYHYSEGPYNGSTIIAAIPNQND